MEEQKDNLLPKTFFWMFLGLLGTALMAWYTYSSGLFYKIALTGSFSGLLIAELVVVLLFSFLFKRLPPTIVAILYFVYSLLNGVTFSTIFIVFQLNSIILLFVICALLFGGLALLGYKTDKDLSNWHNLLYGVLIACLLVSIINLFLGNSFVDIVLDWVILFIFFGITVYDMNKIRMLEADPSLDHSKLHIYCAMELYLDFINMFLRLLSIFGKRKN